MAQCDDSVAFRTSATLSFTIFKFWQPAIAARIKRISL
jgi:hypothetical protein